MKHRQMELNASLVEIVACGSLLALDWLIYRQQRRGTTPETDRELVVARHISKAWRVLEEVNGEGCMLEPQSKIVLRALLSPGSRHIRHPELLENAHRLKRLNGPEWWSKQHQLSCHLAKVRLPTIQP